MSEPIGEPTRPAGREGSGPAGFEVLEHTADVGIRAWAGSLAGAFEQAGLALAEILGARAGSPTESRRVRASGADPGALLVDFLNELLLLHEAEEVALAAPRVTRLDPGPGGEHELEADVGIEPLEGEPEGTAVKAATYHHLRVEERREGAEVQVYLDV